MSLFVDTSIYAAADLSDASNARAKAVLAAGEALVTTDHVLIETWTLLRRRIRRHAAERFWEGLRSGVAAIEPVGAADLEAAWQIGVVYRDQDFSIVDRTSFAVMRRLGIERAASLDDLCRFSLRPQPPPGFHHRSLKTGGRASSGFRLDWASMLEIRAIPQEQGGMPRVERDRTSAGMIDLMEEVPATWPARPCAAHPYSWRNATTGSMCSDLRAGT
ncbi:MAG: PIN domain-containing protein [Acidobacteria bacterium]|nr:PIN domain-containing protein [Acidobacteriota bacterium]